MRVGEKTVTHRQKNMQIQQTFLCAEVFFFSSTLFFQRAGQRNKIIFKSCHSCRVMLMDDKAGCGGRLDLVAQRKGGTHH